MHNLEAQNQTMTLKEITDLLGVRHNDAMKTVAKMAQSTEFGELRKIRISYINNLGASIKIETYKLDKRQSMAVSAKLNTALLMRVIDRWQELEEKEQPSTLPKNFAQALRLAADQQEEIEKKKLQIEQKNQLIIASNEASIKAGEILVSEFCKSVDIVDIGATKFYDWMREQGLVFKHSREPMQKYRDRGFFTWKPTEDQYGGKFRYTLRITPRGKVWLAAKYMQFLDNEAAVA